jgi:hypothetical protein
MRYLLVGSYILDGSLSQNKTVLVANSSTMTLSSPAPQNRDVAVGGCYRSGLRGRETFHAVSAAACREPRPHTPCAVNLLKEPFSLPQPLDLYNEFDEEGKFLLLYSAEQLSGVSFDAMEVSE